MSKKPSSSTAVTIPDSRDTHIKQEIQYGVVWPDGTHTWKEISRGVGASAIQISTLVLGVDDPDYDAMSQWQADYWTELVEGRARSAKLDVDEYKDLHHFIKRTVVLAVTATEVA